MMDRTNGHANGSHSVAERHRETPDLERTLLVLRAEVLSSIDTALERIARLKKELAAQATCEEQGGGSRRRSLLF